MAKIEGLVEFLWYCPFCKTVIFVETMSFLHRLEEEEEIECEVCKKPVVFRNVGRRLE